jgi:hypothetical protein
VTRKSKREIERAVDDLDGGDGDDGGLSVVYKDARTGEYYEDGDMAGEPVDPDALSGTAVVIGRGAVVMFREQAEQEGREILGPAEDAPDETDAVLVAIEDD